VTNPDTRVVAVVLAAGTSSRMGEANKLLAAIDGTPLVRRVLDQVCASRVSSIIVVTGHQESAIHRALQGCDVTFTHNGRYEDGLSTSLLCGLEKVPQSALGAIICLGDMPKLKVEHIDRLVIEFGKHKSEKICVPVFDGQQGNPVVWPQKYFTEMQALTGDTGAKKLIAHHQAHVVEIDMDDDSVTQDIDTPDDLKKFQD